MAMISCPQCGNSISDKAIVCPHCKSILVIEHNSKIDIYKKKIINNKKIIIAVVVVAIVGLLLFVDNYSKNNRYEKALSLMLEGKVEEAYDIFSGLGNYKNSTKYAKDLNNKICFQEAIDLLNDGNFIEAKIRLDKVDVDYSDAKKYKEMTTSKVRDVSDEAFLGGAYVIDFIKSATFKKDIGDKMNNSILKRFGNNTENVKQLEFMDLLYNEQYIKDVLDLIESIPEKDRCDSDFKLFIRDIFIIKLDSIYGRYVEVNGENCSDYYKIFASLLGVDSDSIYDLDVLSDSFVTVLWNGEESLDYCIDLTEKTSQMTFFHGLSD